MPGEMKSVAPPRLTKDQFVEQNMEILENLDSEKKCAQFSKYISWIVSLTNRYSWVDVYDFDAQVRADYEDKRIVSWDPILLGFCFQHTFTGTLRLLDDKRGKNTRKKKVTRGRTECATFFSLHADAKKDGTLDLSKRVASASLRHTGRRITTNEFALEDGAELPKPALSVMQELAGEKEHLGYKQEVEAMGALVSPLTERADRWARAAWGLPGAEGEGSVAKSACEGDGKIGGAADVLCSMVVCGAKMYLRREAPRDLDDWMVTDWLWEKARKLGPFVVDACCDNVGANSRCFRWWSEEDSCLLRHWRRLNVYCNPPFCMIGY
eukprot:gene13700-biopygen14088